MNSLFDLGKMAAILDFTSDAISRVLIGDFELP